MRYGSKQYKTAWFWIDPDDPGSGPVSLYARVRQVFSTPRRLAIKPERLAKLAKTWPMTQEEMATIPDFYPEDWTLYAVCARMDTGKFIMSTWYRTIGDKNFFVEIRYGDCIERLRWARNLYVDDIAMWCDNHNKEAVEFVEKANAALLAEKAPFPPPERPLPPRETEATHG